MKPFQSSSDKETKEYGARLAKQIANKKGNNTAVIVALYGDLGSGKTTFTQGFLSAFDIEDRVSSPTFVIMRRFSLPKGPFKNAYHIDAYRLHNNETANLGLGVIFSNPQNLVLIEWPENIKKIIPKESIKISFEHGESDNDRTIKLHN